MGYIPSAETVYAVAYLTELGRTYLFDKDGIRFDGIGDDLFEITKFTLSDADTNYQTILNLSSGEVPDVTGKNDGCLKTTSNYVQNNLIAYVFDNTPTDVEYATDLPEGIPPILLIPESSLPSGAESVPANVAGPIIFSPPGGLVSG